jgi:hypothetical protein
VDGEGDTDALHFGKNHVKEETGNENAQAASMSKRGERGKGSDAWA